MDETRSASPIARARAAAASGGTAIVETPFIIVGKGRSGTTLLVQALNSSPELRCFGELFNWRRASIDYGLPGYDGFDPADLRLRASDPLAFLGRRVFSGHPPQVRAAGFKLPYDHYLAINASPAEIANAYPDLRVIRVRRRNLLRSIVSAEIAERTQLWVDDTAARPIAPVLSRLRYGIAHPRWFVSKLQRRLWLRRRGATTTVEAVSVRLSAERIRAYVYTTMKQVESWDDIFRSHAQATIWYEDIAQDPQATLEEAWIFLDVPPAPLSITMRRQNPQPLRELLDNYDELRAEFAGTPIARFFDEEA